MPVHLPGTWSLFASEGEPLGKTCCHILDSSHDQTCFWKNFLGLLLFSWTIALGLLSVVDLLSVVGLGLRHFPVCKLKEGAPEDFNELSSSPSEQ